VIIYRYLSRQLFWTTVAVSSVLVVILVCGQFVRFLNDVAEGRLGADVVFLVMAYQMPGMLQLILPLGLFLGVMLCYGRMYLENEMVVLETSGVGPGKLMALTVIPTLMMTLLVGALSFYLTPAGGRESKILEAEQDRKSGLEVLTPGRFYSARRGGMVTYIENIADDGDHMETVFIMTHDEARPDRLSLVRAQTAQYRKDAASGARYLVLGNGYRDEGSPGEADFVRSSFDRYEIKIKDPAPVRKAYKYSNKTLLALWQEDSAEAQAELQWRISLVLLVPIVVLMAVPLSKVSPRQGRYLKLLPSILLHLGYVTLLMSAKNAMEKGKLPPELGIMWVHIPFLLLGIFLNNWVSLKLRLSSEDKNLSPHSPQPPTQKSMQ